MLPLRSCRFSFYTHTEPLFSSLKSWMFARGDGVCVCACAYWVVKFLSAFTSIHWNYRHVDRYARAHQCRHTPSARAYFNAWDELYYWVTYAETADSSRLFAATPSTSITTNRWSGECRSQFLCFGRISSVSALLLWLEVHSLSELRGLARCSSIFNRHLKQSLRECAYY